MKRTLLMFVAVGAIAFLCGCLHNQIACGDRGSCPVEPCGRHYASRCPGPACRTARPAREAAVSRQPAAAVYPYYTTRGPRDFFERTPSPIGP